MSITKKVTLLNKFDAPQRKSERKQAKIKVKKNQQIGF